MKNRSLRLIIWRSQVQALAGPHWKSRSYIKNIAPFSLFCEQFANKIAFREHQYNLSAIIDSLILFANPIIFVRKSFFGILFSNISNTSKLSDETLNYPFISTLRPPLSGPSWRIKPLVCKTLKSRQIVLASTLKCHASEADVSRTFSRTFICPVSISRLNIFFCLSVSCFVFFF